MDPVTDDGLGRSVVVQPRLAPTTIIPTTPIPAASIPTASIPAAKSRDRINERLAESPQTGFTPPRGVVARPTLTIADPDAIPTRNPNSLGSDGWDAAPAERAAYDEATAAGTAEDENGVKPRFELPSKVTQRYQPGDSIPINPLDNVRARYPDSTLSDAAENAAGALIGTPSGTPPSPPKNAFGGDRIPNRYPDDASAGSRYELPKAPAVQPKVADGASRALTDTTDPSGAADPAPAFSSPNLQPAATVDALPRYTAPATSATQPRRPEFARQPTAFETDSRVVPSVGQPIPGYSEQPGTTFVAAAVPADQGYQANKLTPQQAVPPTNQSVSQNNTELKIAQPPAEPAERPWFFLTMTLFALFASLGGNLFLGWVTWDIRLRFRELLIRARRDGEGIREGVRDDSREGALDGDYDSRRDI